MAVRYYNKIGKMTVTRTKTIDGQKVPYHFPVTIWDGNCLAVFTTEDKENRYLFMFFGNEQHVKNIIEDHGSLWGSDSVSRVRLNMYYKASRQLLDIFTRNGYKVTCYYKEPKK